MLGMKKSLTNRAVSSRHVPLDFPRAHYHQISTRHLTRFTPKSAPSRQRRVTLKVWMDLPESVDGVLNVSSLLTLAEERSREFRQCVPTNSFLPRHPCA